MQIMKIIGLVIFASNYIFCSSQDRQPPILYCPGLKPTESMLSCHNSYQTDRLEVLKREKIIEDSVGECLFNDELGCLGQTHDIQALKNKIESVGQDLILHCHSRGGAAAINYMAEYNDLLVKALVLDAVPADFVRRVELMQRIYGLWFFTEREGQEWMMRRFYRGYPKNSVPPVQAISQIQNKDLPVLLVHCEKDTIVNISDALDNYKAFKQAGFSHVYFCSLERGGHDHNAEAGSKDYYKAVLHSFYKKYNYKYDASLATIDNLEELQPTVEDVDAQIRFYRNKLCKKNR